LNQFLRVIVLYDIESLAAARGPEFEVATVKLSPPPEGDLININLGTMLRR
jgi:hypothetical protein